MKVRYLKHLTNSSAFVRLFDVAAMDAKVQRKEPFELRIAGSSRAVGNWDAASRTLHLLLNQLLILPVSIFIISLVIMFIGISLSISAVQLWLPKDKSLLGLTAP